MKKLVSMVSCILMLLSVSVCFGQGAKQDEVVFPPFAEYKIGGWTVNLPQTYVSQDLKAVKAESSCVAMYKDKDNKLPNLWVYEGKLAGKTFQDVVFGMNISPTNAYLFHYENWYGELLANEIYCKLMDKDTILFFSFSYKAEGADERSKHALIWKLAAQMGIFNQ